MKSQTGKQAWKSCLWVLCWFCLGLVPGKMIAQAYDMARFDENQGLGEKYIYTITQDPRGFLWLGTGRGLIRFDGAQFRKYGPRNGLAEEFVTVSLLDSQGKNWFGHSGGGVSWYQNNLFDTLAVKDKITSALTGVTEDQNGSIWFCSQRGKVLHAFKPDSLEIFEDAFKGLMLYSIAATSQGDLLIGNSEGLLRARPANGTLEIVEDFPGIPLTSVVSIQKSALKDQFWVATEDAGFYLLELKEESGKSSVKAFNSQTGYSDGPINYLLEDDNRNLWIGTSGAGVKKYQIHQDQSLAFVAPQTTEDSTLVSSDIVRCIFHDNHRQIWLGTYGKGLVCLSEEIFTLFKPRFEEEIKGINAILQDGKSNFWFGTDNGIYIVPDSQLQDHGYRYTMQNVMNLQAVSRISANNGLPSDEITALYENVNGDIWVGTRSMGIAVIHPRDTSIVLINLKDLALSRAVNAIRGDKQGNIWVATKDGAFQFARGEFNYEYYTTREGLAHNNIYDIYPDSKGRIWLATHTNKVSVYNQGEISQIDIRVGDEVPAITCITEDANGALWLGTDGFGIYRYKDGDSIRNYNSLDHGLMSNYCYRIVPDRLNNIWVGHRNGMSRFIQNTKKIVSYENKINLPFEETLLRSAFRSNSGDLWFGTPKGVIRYNSYRDDSDINPPQIFLVGMEIQGEPRRMREGLTLDYDTYQFRFEFLGLTFINQADVRYKYRLEGRDQNWSELTASNTKTYQGLNDGTYTFYVHASNKEGLWSETPATFTFTIGKPFWKQNWFRLLGLVLLLILFILLIRYRTSRLKKEKEALENKIQERTKELIAEKEKVDEANRELQMLSLVARETDNAVVIFDQDGYLEWVNQGFTRMTGFTFEEIDRKRGQRTWAETTTSIRGKELLDEAIRDNKSISYESQVPSKDLSEGKWVLSTLTPILDENGIMKRLVIIDSDITERKLAEQKIHQMNAELEALVEKRTEQLRDANEDLTEENQKHLKTLAMLKSTNEELDTFIYKASHDLKGPLTSLMGLVNIAQMEVEDPTARQYIDLIDRSSLKLNDILSGLLEATRIKQGEVHFDHINLHQLASDTLDRVMERQGNPETSVSIGIPEDFNLISDPDLLGTILEKCIDNSFCYRDPTKDEHLVQINLENAEKGIWIEVIDNGQGIPEEHHKKVFEMFFRGNARHIGIGLGLYIAQNAIEKLKGKIICESEPDAGSTFRIFIPHVNQEDVSVAQLENKRV